MSNVVAAIGRGQLKSLELHKQLKQEIRRTYEKAFADLEWKPMHLQPVFADCDFFPHSESGSVGEDIFARGLCLPSDIKNTKEDMDQIIAIVRGVLGK